MESTFRPYPPSQEISPNVCFNPCFNGIDIQTSRTLALVQAWYCFNPCFNGIDIQTQVPGTDLEYSFSFNPCFNGIDIQTLRGTCGQTYHQYVSILVLMESTFRLFKACPTLWRAWYVSILVLMESTFRHTVRAGNAEIFQWFQSLF